GSLAQTDNLHSKPLSEGKRDESKESLSNVCSIFCHTSQCVELFY
ncbi:hypothetical protein Anapl_04976, partial [Anas platyrhynchos]